MSGITTTVRTSEPAAPRRPVAVYDGPSVPGLLSVSVRCARCGTGHLVTRSRWEVPRPLRCGNCDLVQDLPTGRDR